MDNKQFEPAIINMFKQEAGKHILKTNNALLTIEKEGLRSELLAEMKREIHTLKGDSRMVGLLKISEAAHKLEDLLFLIEKKEKKLDEKTITLIFKSLDLFTTAVDSLPHEEINVDFYFLFTEQGKETAKNDGQFELFSDNQHGGGNQTESNVSTSPAVDPVKGINEVKSGDINFITVGLKKIDELINVFSAFPRYSGRFSFLVNQLRQLREELKKNSISEDLVKALDLIIYNFSHEITFYDLSAKQFQNDMVKLKLVPLSTIFDLFPRLVRDTARETAKNINLTLKGRDVELDKVVVEKLKEILIHILNNAVGHGCETPGEREKLGKPSTGNIILSASNKGDNVVIEISDDGQGINIDKVKEKAVERGFITREIASGMVDEDAIPFIFETGFSTAAISKLSGRGVGMDIVAKVVKDLNGEIQVKTWRNKGTTFIISLPLISFFIPVTIFSLGENMLGFPSTHIMSTLRVHNSEIKKVTTEQSVIRVNNLEISLIDLPKLFYNTTGTEDNHKNIILVQSQDEVAGFIVSDIIIEKKMVIKKVTGLFEQLKIIIGAVLLGNEKAIPILNVAELFKVLKEGRSSLAKIRIRDGNKEKIWAKNVLLVDDSPITRDQEKQILLGQHLNVFEAANGKEALKLLDGKAFDIIITDIEMPVMDGVTLIKTVKADAKLAALPVVVVSSYKEFQHKLYDLGVRHFIDKTSFTSQILINVLKEERIL